jgi:hypothetical protein
MALECLRNISTRPFPSQISPYASPALLRTLAILTLSQGKNSPFKLLCRVASLVPHLLASPYYLVIAGQRTLEAYMLLYALRPAARRGSRA